MLAFIFGLNRRQLPQQQQPKMRGEKMTKEDWREREKKIERSKLNQSRKISIKAERQEKCKLEKAMIQERLEPFPSHKGNTDKYMVVEKWPDINHI
uniref:Uncharacterized protein n=1 Tax=Tetranychus urticae TaxID=32264 RepID=T1JQK1_TETUR